ncbi:hypothetical protein V6B08_20420 [Ferrovibrio sp. MS7]|uniref:hypothetical protein n=1 Tax=Ferrovibrio plantarum TaxID=3119164 RepID=UPI003134D5DA
MPTDEEKTALRRKVKSIRLSYNTILDRLARLTSFANALESETEVDINERQKSLFVDDIIALAINARRFLSDLEMTKASQKAHVPLLGFYFKQNYEDVDIYPSTKTIPISRILNIIIHHKELVIFRSKMDIVAKLIIRPRNIESSELDSFFHIYNITQKLRMQKIKPIMSIQSDKPTMLVLQVSEFISVFSEAIFTKAIEHCEDHEIFLNDNWDEY